MKHIFKIDNEFSLDKEWIFAGYVNTRPDPIDTKYSLSDKVYVLFINGIHSKDVIVSATEIWSDFKPQKDLEYVIIKSVITHDPVAQATKKAIEDEYIFYSKKIETEFPQYHWKYGCPRQIYNSLREDSVGRLQGAKED